MARAARRVRAARVGANRHASRNRIVGPRVRRGGAFRSVGHASPIPRMWLRSSIDLAYLPAGTSSMAASTILGRFLRCKPPARCGLASRFALPKRKAFGNRSKPTRLEKGAYPGMGAFSPERRGVADPKRLRSAYHIHSMFIVRPMYRMVPLSLIRATGVSVYWICSAPSANPDIHIRS